MGIALFTIYNENNRLDFAEEHIYREWRVRYF